MVLDLIIKYEIKKVKVGITKFQVIIILLSYKELVKIKLYGVGIIFLIYGKTDVSLLFFGIKIQVLKLIQMANLLGVVSIYQQKDFIGLGMV